MFKKYYLISFFTVDIEWECRNVFKARNPIIAWNMALEYLKREKGAGWTIKNIVRIK